MSPIFTSGARMRGASFFSRHLAPHQRAEDRRLADDAPGLACEARSDLGQREVVIGVEVGRNLRVVLDREDPGRAVTLGGRCQRAGRTVAVEPLLDGAEADVEAVGDLGLGGVACEGGGDDAASEVERERGGQGRGRMGRALKPSSYSMVDLGVA